MSLIMTQLRLAFVYLYDRKRNFTITNIGVLLCVMLETAPIKPFCVIDSELQVFNFATRYYKEIP